MKTQFKSKITLSLNFRSSEGHLTLVWEAGRPALLVQFKPSFDTLGPGQLGSRQLGPGAQLSWVRSLFSHNVYVKIFESLVTNAINWEEMRRKRGNGEKERKWRGRKSLSISLLPGCHRLWQRADNNVGNFASMLHWILFLSVKFFSNRTDDN